MPATARPLTLGDTLDPQRHRIIAEDYADGPFLLDPFFRLVEEGSAPAAIRLHDIAPDHFRRSEYFRVHYGRTGIGEEIGVFFDMGGGLTGVTSFGRWDASPPITRADLDILRALEPAIGALCAGALVQPARRGAERSRSRACAHPGLREPDAA